MILSVRYGGIYIEDKTSRLMQCVITFDSIERLYFEPKSLYIHVNELDSMKYYRFDTYFNWEIYNLIDVQRKLQ